MIDETRVREWVRDYLVRLLGMPAEAISLDCTLADYGLDSVDAVVMAGELEFAFNLEIDPAAFLQYDTIEAMVVALPAVGAGSGGARTGG
jgi:phthiocerol/phenolphthiocerol synthesis type-I polyketide synthase B